MGQPARVAARQAALQALRQRRERQAEREKQIDASVYDLAYAFTEREQAVAAALAGRRTVRYGRPGRSVSG